MTRSIILKTPQAQRDLDYCYAYLDERNPEAAERFLHAAETAFARLADMPYIGAAYKVKNSYPKELRRSLVREFEKYQIFYLPIDGGIDVIRVLHGARDIRTIMDYDE